MPFHVASRLDLLHPLAGRFASCNALILPPPPTPGAPPHRGGGQRPDRGVRHGPDHRRRPPRTDLPDRLRRHGIKAGREGVVHGPDVGGHPHCGGIQAVGIGR